MDTRTLATLLLIGHALAVLIMVLVLKRQIKILMRRPDPELRAGRVALFVLAIATLVGNFIPIAIDILVIAGQVRRNNPSPAGITYALSNVLILLTSAGAILALYMIAERLLNKRK